MLQESLCRPTALGTVVYIQHQGWPAFGEHVPKLSTHFEKIISRAHWNFEEQNKVLQSSIIVNNNSILIINKYCNYIV